MKHIKLYENFDFGDDDFDFEEEDDTKTFISSSNFKIGDTVKINNDKTPKPYQRDENDRGIIDRIQSDYDYPIRVVWDTLTNPKKETEKWHQKKIQSHTMDELLLKIR